MYLLGLVLISKSAYSILFRGYNKLYGRIANKMTIGEVAAQGILRANKAACGCFSSKKDCTVKWIWHWIWEMARKYPNAVRI